MMSDNIFFCNINFGKKLSGVERSSFKRSILLSQYSSFKVTFLTANFNLDIEQIWKHYKNIGWVAENSEHINVYMDILGYYFDGLIKPNSVDLLKDDCHVENIGDKGQRIYNQKNERIKYVEWREEARQNLSYINHFYKGKKIQRDRFLCSGQLIVKQYLDENNNVYLEDFFDTNGIRLISRKFDLIKKNISYIYLFDKSNQLLEVFSHESELLTWWLKKKFVHRQNIFLIDKNRVWAKPLHELKRISNQKIISVVHSSHLREYSGNIEDAALNSNYMNILNGDIDIDHLVVLTEQQTQHILDRFKIEDKIATIPHAIDFEVKKINFKNRDRDKIITLSRLAPEKQIDHMIYAMQEVVKIYPTKKLHIYGDGALKNDLNKLIYDLGLQNNVFLEGYIENISEILNQSVLYLSTSKVEGFALTYLESIGHGVPIISYDICYSPSTIIKHGKNGFLVEKDNKSEFSKYIISFFKKKDSIENMSNESYKLANNFTMDKIAKKWDSILIS